MRPLQLALLACGLALYGQPAFGAGLAHLGAVSGDVAVLPHTTTVWHVGHSGEELAAGDSIKTGAQSEATIDRIDGSTVELLPFAQLTIADEEGFALQAGQLWSHFMHAIKAPFYIRTPNATALIRGTTLSVSFEGDRSRVVVYEGLVEVHDRVNGTQDVPGGFRVEIDRAGRLQHFEHAEARDLDQGRSFRSRHGLEGSVAPEGRNIPRREGSRAHAVGRAMEGRMIEHRVRGAEAHMLGSMALKADLLERRQHVSEQVNRKLNPCASPHVMPTLTVEPHATTDTPRVIEPPAVPTHVLEQTQRTETGCGVVTK